MKKCELCTSAANMYCESDSASLCWDCDAKVHSANFLVERHSRSLLCHVCSSPTAWSASGPSLSSRTLSVCRPCVLRKSITALQREQVERDFDTEDDYDYNSEEDEEEDDEDDDDEDEQVVPSPLASSGDEESSTEKGPVSNKRLRDFSSHHDDFGCSSSHINAVSFLARDSGASVCVDSLNCIKRLRTQSDKAEAVISDTLAVGSASDDSS